MRFSFLTMGIIRAVLIPIFFHVSLISAFSQNTKGLQSNAAFSRNLRKSSALKMNESPKNLFFADFLSDKQKTNGVTVIAGATGYIGRAVVRESVQKGYTTYALVRDSEYIDSEEGKQLFGEPFNGARVVQCDPSDSESITKLLRKIKNEEGSVDNVISCLAAASGKKKEVYAIDYQATLNCLDAGRDENVNADHFVLLSAFCVRRPLLQLQQAKLKVSNWNLSKKK